MSFFSDIFAWLESDSERIGRRNYNRASRKRLKSLRRSCRLEFELLERRELLSGGISATFSGPSLVGEGTTSAQVAFTNVSGGQGVLRYSYDFGNTGTFEIADSKSAQATVPESYLDDGPYIRVIHGRITDVKGNFADFTTSITINDRAPTSSITPTSTLDAGAPAAFKASATDPSTADTNAGFTFAWSFGDASTGA